MKDFEDSSSKKFDNVEELIKRPGRVNLADLATPVRSSKRVEVITAEDEFFGVYCLISRNELKKFKNKCYIGYTVNPNRRIRQHNAGQQFGGAKKTDNKGPWDMVCIIHGFPNSISALRFEWAWQNPSKSKRLREIDAKKNRRFSHFQHCLRIACHMLNSDPWRRLSLVFRWLMPEFEIPFPEDVLPPSHVKIVFGVVEKKFTIVPQQLNEYSFIKNCHLCDKKIAKISHLIRCLNFENCGKHFHVRCLAENALAATDDLFNHIVPLEAKCVNCDRQELWGDLIRDQRMLLAVDDAKPKINDEKIADGMIPLKICKKQ